MSKTSWNLSRKLHFTIDHFDETSYFGELEHQQKVLLRLSNEETAALIAYLSKEEPLDI